MCSSDLVLSLKRSGNTCVVRAKPDLWNDGWHEGSILDTENLKAGIKYGFGGGGKHLYHPDALKALGVDGEQRQREG